MARSSSYTYNPATGKWTKSTTETNTTEKETPKSPPSNSSGSSSSAPKSAPKSNLTSTNSNKDTSTGSTEKKYNTIEYNTLSGSLKFIATNTTIQIKAGDTITLNGLGKYLSGDYYVQDVTRSIGSSGYTHSCTVIKTNFGSSLKMSAPEEKKVQKPVASSAPSTNQRTYTVKKGDCLWNIAKQYYGNGSAYGKIYDANTKQIANPNLIYPGQVFIIP